MNCISIFKFIISISNGTVYVCVCVCFLLCLLIPQPIKLISYFEIDFIVFGHLDFHYLICNVCTKGAFCMYVVLIIAAATRHM